MKYLVNFFLLMVFVAAISCKPKKDLIYMANNTEGSIQAEISKVKFEGLKIQEGDKLQIQVSAFDDIAVRPFNLATMESTASVAAKDAGGAATQADLVYTVSPDGYIVMPVLGEIHVKGMTKPQLKADLEKRLLKYLNDPLVTITLVNFNFAVLGEVAGPGQKTSTTEKLNIFQAIALSGDIKPTGNRTNVRVIRSTENDGAEKIARLNLTDESVVSSPYYYIQQNDIIYVEPDKNAQIAAKTTPAVDTFVKYFGIGVSIISLYFLLTRR